MHGLSHPAIVLVDLLRRRLLAGLGALGRRHGRADAIPQLGRHGDVRPRPDGEPPRKREVNREDLRAHQLVEAHLPRDGPAVGDDEERLVGARVGHRHHGDTGLEREARVPFATAEAHAVALRIRPPRIDVSAGHHHQIAPPVREHVARERVIGAEHAARPEESARRLGREDNLVGHWVNGPVRAEAPIPPREEPPDIRDGRAPRMVGHDHHRRVGDVLPSMRVKAEITPRAKEEVDPSHRLFDGERAIFARIAAPDRPF